MTHEHLRAGILALILPVAMVSSVAAQAQEDCNCSRGDFPFVLNTEPGAFSFWMGSQARVGIGFSSAEQDGYLDVGAVITEVVEDSPAEEAGLEVGDVVVSVDGHALMEPLERALERRMDEDGSVPVQRLLALAREWEADEPVELEILRDDDRMDLTVVPEARGDSEPMRLRMRELNESLGAMAPRIRSSLRGIERAPQVRVWGGDGDGFEFFVGRGALSELEMTEVNPQLGRYFGVDSGVLVTEVGEDSTLGLEPGDIVLAVGDREVESPRDVRRILRSYDADEAVNFEVRRQGMNQTVTGSLN